MKRDGPIEITPELEAKCDGPHQFKKFDRLVRNVLAVPPKRKDEKPHSSKAKKKDP